MQQLERLPIPAERRPTLFKKCLSIPARYEAYDELSISWKDPSIFEKEQPLVIEYCSGNGQWIAHMAQTHPDINWIAVERDYQRCGKIWRKMGRLKISNLFLVVGDAYLFSHHYLQNSVVKEVYVNFPDPWPKRRHAKNRLIQKRFVDELSRIIEPNGAATIVTDDAVYSEQMIKEFGAWTSAFDPQFFVTEWPDFGESYFHSLWSGKNRTIRYHRFLRK